MEYREVAQYDRAFSAAAAEDLRLDVEGQGINQFILKASSEFAFSGDFPSLRAFAELLQKVDQFAAGASKVETETYFLRGASIGLYALHRQLPADAWHDLASPPTDHERRDLDDSDNIYADIGRDICRNSYHTTASAYTELIEGWMGHLAPANPKGAEAVRLGFGFVFYQADRIKRQHMDNDLQQFEAEIDDGINWDAELRGMSE